MDDLVTVAWQLGRSTHVRRTRVSLAHGRRSGMTENSSIVRRVLAIRYAGGDESQVHVINYWTDAEIAELGELFNGNPWHVRKAGE